MVFALTTLNLPTLPQRPEPRNVLVSLAPESEVELRIDRLFKVPTH